MPTYQVPDVVEVEFSRLELPKDVPVDEQLNEKPLSECTKQEVEQAVRAFTTLVRHAQREIEQHIAQQIELRRRLAHLQAYLEHYDDIAWVRQEAV
ncbi:MAG TPA: hypothetical protein VFY39_00765 [Gammaproteobacteria bacterium]|nr:hypothetical protein [Gammaproteobacteria bacterium]